MKTACLTLITLVFFVRLYAQEAGKADSLSVLAMKTYLSRNIRPPAIMMEQHIQGRVIAAFKIDSNKKVNAIHILKSLTDIYDAEVIRALKAYSKDVLLPPDEYSIGVQFIIKNKKLDNGNVPIDKSLYQNFLFDLNVIAIFPY